MVAGQGLGCDREPAFFVNADAFIIAQEEAVPLVPVFPQLPIGWPPIPLLATQQSEFVPRPRQHSSVCLIVHTLSFVKVMS